MSKQDKEKKQISAEAYYVTQQHGTEPAFSGNLNDNKEPGENMFAFVVDQSYLIILLSTILVPVGQVFISHLKKIQLLTVMIMKLVI